MFLRRCSQALAGAGFFGAKIGIAALIGLPRARAAYMPSYDSRFVCHTEHIQLRLPSDSDENAPTQIGRVICCPTSRAAHTESKGSQNAQRSYERYLALARTEALSGNMIGAENYYQHAEHYFRLMSSDRGTT